MTELRTLLLLGFDTHGTQAVLRIEGGSRVILNAEDCEKLARSLHELARIIRQRHCKEAREGEKEVKKIEGVLG